MNEWMSEWGKVWMSEWCVYIHFQNVTYCIHKAYMCKRFMYYTYSFIVYTWKINKRWDFQAWMCFLFIGGTQIGGHARHASLIVVCSKPGITESFWQVNPLNLCSMKDGWKLVRTTRTDHYRFWPVLRMENYSFDFIDYSVLVDGTTGRWEKQGTVKVQSASFRGSDHLYRVGERRKIEEPKPSMDWSTISLLSESDGLVLHLVTNYQWR